MTTSDKNLIYRIVQRDEEAFDILYARYEDGLRRHLLHMVRDSGRSEDLLQEVFLRVWTRADQWRGEGSVKSWLFRIGTNLSLNRLRSQRRRKETSLQLPADTSRDDDDEYIAPGWMVDAAALGPDELAEQAENRGLLRRFVSELPEDKREVLRLVYDADMGISETAEILGIPEGTVKSRLYHARKQIQCRWGMMWEE